MNSAVGVPLLVIAIALQILACSPAQDETNEAGDIPADVYSNSAAESYLEPSEREDIEAEALKGDQAAMDAIIDHYSLGAKEPDIDRLMYWLRIAYERGDQGRLYDLVYWASDSDLECAEIVSLYNALEKLDPAAAKTRRTGKVAECLNDGIRLR